MARKTERKIVAVVAAYNEEGRIGPVLRTLLSYPGFREVIVIDDGSTDQTAKRARSLGAKVIQNTFNLGKGASMERGVRQSTAPIIFFCDADVRGLTHTVIDAIVTPVARGKVDMLIGMRNRKIYFTRLILKFIPLLGGERACTRSLWEEVPDEYKEGFKIESALNFYASRDGKKYDFRVFRGLTQTIKEKKYGLWCGLRSRIHMFYEIIEANVKLHLYLLFSFLDRAVDDNE